MVARNALAVTGGAPVGGGRQYQSRDGTLGSWSTEAPDDWDWSGDEDGFWPVSRLRQGYIDYLTAKMLEYEEQKEARHYYHGAQWTPEEIKILKSRRQPIVTFNRISRKVDSTVGLVQRVRADPKAFPRNPKNGEGAEIATQVVRSILDGADWNFIDPFCAGQAGIEGIAGVEFKLVQGDHDDPDISMDFVFGDDFFYDPRSFKPDFSDARYMGIAKWLDVEAAIELFPHMENELRTLMVETGFDLTTHADREFKWVYTNEKRLRLVEMWYRYRGKWNWAFFCSMILLDQGESPFIDERGNPTNRFEMFSANVDHDGDRYGLVRNLKGPQDELNQRRSKALWMSNVTRVLAQKGAVDNVENARREMAKPDGWVEYNMGFEEPKPADKTTDLAQQLALMQDARSEIDSFANISPDLVTRDVPGDHSGVAINLLQKAGISELGSYLRNYKAWKKRVYRKAWNLAQGTWQAERWIRVTDSENVAQFIQVNGFERDEYGRPTFINLIGQLSVEMTMDEGPEVGSLMQDAYETLAKYPPGAIPPQVLIELSPLPSREKQRVMQLMQQPQDPVADQAKQITLRQMQADADEKTSRAMRHRSQMVSDAATAAHKMSEAHLNAQEGFARALAPMVSPSGQPGMPGGGAPGMPGAGPTPQPGQAPGGVPAPSSTPPGAASMPVQPAGSAMQPGIAQLARALGARQAPDGRHYIPDPNRPGKFLMMAA